MGQRLFLGRKTRTTTSRSTDFSGINTRSDRSPRISPTDLQQAESPRTLRHRVYMKLNLVFVLALFLAGAMEVQAAAVRDETIRGKNDALAADHEDTAENGAYDDEYLEAREEFDDIDINSDGLIDRGELQAVDNHVRWANSQQSPGPTKPQPGTYELTLQQPASASRDCTRPCPHYRWHLVTLAWRLALGAWRSLLYPSN